MTNGPAGGLFSLGLSNGAGYLPLGFVPVDLLFDSTGMYNLIALPFNASGAFSAPLPVPNDPQYIGLSIFLQAFRVDGIGVTASNALEAKICP